MSPLDDLRDQRYISLETYRRNGNPVRTPVWFAENGGRLYLYSAADAGKVKRIRHTPRVAFTPSDARGRISDSAIWLQGNARILSQEEARNAHKLLVEKYGWQRRLIDLFWFMGGRRPRAAIEITLPSSG